MRDLKAYNTLLDMLFLSFMKDLNIQGTILIHTQRGVFPSNSTPCTGCSA